MSARSPSVVSGYRGSRVSATWGNPANSGEFWDPLVRGYGPVNVFNEEEIRTTNEKNARQIDYTSDDSDRRRSYASGDSNNNNDNNEQNNNKDRRDDDSRQY